MKLTLRKLYLVGCWSFGLVCGVGHIAFELAPKPAAAEALMQELRAFPVSMPGTETNAFALTFGVSMVMGLMLVAYGVVNLLVLRDTPKPRLPARAFLWANTVFSFAAFVLAGLYLFMVPIVFTGVAFACFTLCLIGADRRDEPSA